VAGGSWREFANENEGISRLRTGGHVGRIKWKLRAIACGSAAADRRLNGIQVNVKRMSMHAGRRRSRLVESARRLQASGRSTKRDFFAATRA